MADNNEKFASQQAKMADERKTIDTFADFGNMYNFKKILPIPIRPMPV